MRIIKLTRLPKDKDQQVAITVREMIAITIAEAWNPSLWWLAEHWRLPHFNRSETAEAYERNIRRRVKFRFDPEEVELIRVPSALAADIRRNRPVFGDCDDMSLLLGTLLYSRGLSVAYVTISTSPHNPEFRHVFVAVRIGEQWRNYDPSVPRPYKTDGLRHRVWAVPFANQPHESLP